MSLAYPLGGMVAQEVAINYPDRVSKLVLGCTCACTDAANGETPEWVAALKAFAESGKVPAMNLMFSTWPWRAIGLVVLRRQFASMDDSDRAGFMSQRQACVAHNTMDRLPSIIVPTLVIVGTGDRILWPSSSDTLARLIPKATLVKIRGCSHMFMAEDRRRFNSEVLAFLSRA
jgi:3-oxoadipate enol-lactonase